jgi:hypothetical protein
MPLRRADTSATKTFRDGDDWLTLRVNLQKFQADQLQDLISNYRVPGATLEGVPAAEVEIRARIAETNAALFGFLAVGWSLSAKPTVEEYRALDEASGQWVDECIQEVLKMRRERAEGNANGSKSPAEPPTPAPEEAASSSPETTPSSSDTTSTSSSPAA